MHSNPHWVKRVYGLFHCEENLGPLKKPQFDFQANDMMVIVKHMVPFGMHMDVAKLVRNGKRLISDRQIIRNGATQKSMKNGRKPMTAVKQPVQGSRH